MALYDFFAPFVRVALTRGDGARLPLWFTPNPLKDADKFGYADAPQVGGLGTNLAIVSGVEIEQSLGNFFIVKVTCTPTYEDAMALLESDAIVTGETLLEVQYGYVASGGELATRIFVGQLTDPDFSIGEAISLTLTAQCTCSASMYGSSTISGDLAKESRTRREWIKLVAAGAGSPPRDVEVNFDGVKGSRELALLDDTFIPLEMAGKNDNIVLRDLLEQCRCDVYYTPNPKKPKSPILKVLDAYTRFGGKGNKTFRLYGFGIRGVRSLGGELNAAGDYPILGVSTQSKQVFIRGVINGTTKPKVDDTKKKDPIVITENAEDKGVPALGPSASKGKVVSKGPKASKLAPGAKTVGDVVKGGTAVVLGDESFPAQKANNEANEFSQFINSGVILNVESIGIPDLEPGAIVQVAGLGKHFDGPYSLTKVVHTLGDGGYSTKWDGINNAGYLQATSAPLKAKVKAIVDAREADGSLEVQPKLQVRGRFEPPPPPPPPPPPDGIPFKPGV